MNNTISSQLYHFTGYDKTTNSFKPDDEAFDILKSIIQSGYLRLSKNDVKLHLLPNGRISSTSVDVKMACVTETPIEYISEHIEKYGKFGIGFNIEWGLAHGGLSVIYTKKENPNGLTTVVSELADFFMSNGMLSHDLRAVTWLSKLSILTENFELRHEREWRFLYAPIMPDGYKGITFLPKDILSIICPKPYVSKVEELLANTRFNPKIIPTETIWHKTS